MISRARKAKADQQIDALFFFQGETDALKKQTAVCYGANLQQLVHDIREDLEQVTYERK